MIYGISRIIYLLRKYDIISVPIIREAYIICEADIIPAGYIIRDKRERISLKKALAMQVLFSGAGGGGRTRTLSPGPDFESGTSANSITPAHVRL